MEKFPKLKEYMSNFIKGKNIPEREDIAPEGFYSDDIDKFKAYVQKLDKYEKQIEKYPSVKKLADNVVGKNMSKEEIDKQYELLTAEAKTEKMSIMKAHKTEFDKIRICKALLVDEIENKLDKTNDLDEIQRLQKIRDTDQMELRIKIGKQLEKYPDELVALAAKKPETIDFVAHYLKYLSASSHPDISIDSDYTPGSIPFFLQWDERWGYEKYGDDLIAINGCGPTCLSMVAVGLTADTSLNPKTVADFSYNNGYLISEQGTSWALMSEGATLLGLDSQMIPADPSLLHNLLKEGTPIIASMSPGHFTTEGHFIVLYDIDDDDLVSVHDPDSITRSKKPWPLSTILDECKCLWQFKSL